MRAIGAGLAATVLLILAAPSQAADPPRPDPAILVTAKRPGGEPPPGPWSRAESEHIVLYGEDDPADLARLSIELERIHALLANALGVDARSSPIAKVRITLVGSAKAFRALGLRELRWQQGPYGAGMAAAIHYDPGEFGDAIVAAREDRIVDLDTNERFNRECDALRSNDFDGNCSAVIKPPPPDVISWKAALFSLYVQRFMLAYRPAAYPRWYLDGIGALFADAALKRGGAIDFALPPPGLASFFKSYRYPDFAAVLAGRPLTDPGAPWSPYAAWLLGHYAFAAPYQPVRESEFARYLDAIRRGTPQAEAAAIFSDPAALQRAVTGQIERKAVIAHGGKAADQPDPPQTARLSAGAGEAVLAAARMDGPLDPALLAEIEAKAARSPQDGGALLLLAEAECRSDRAAACRDAAARAEALLPRDPMPVTWRGIALTRLAALEAAPARGPALAAARAVLRAAMALDSTAAPPRIALFRSYAETGEAVPDDVVAEMVRALQAVPAAPAPRLDLARELVRRGESGLARQVLAPVLYGAFDTPERAAATDLLSAR